jgi:hypothetical protein
MIPVKQHHLAPITHHSKAFNGISICIVFGEMMAYLLVRPSSKLFLRY